MCRFASDGPLHCLMPYGWVERSVPFRVCYHLPRYVHGHSPTSILVYPGNMRSERVQVCNMPYTYACLLAAATLCHSVCNLLTVTVPVVHLAIKHRGIHYM
ncbi:unnamed protein product [Periconia digitata]|uniref:Uncharacterized protein n=1 Tax=Periconia digitata TaxID=1303443 RepID=A0A9W4XQW1_9PLEO|nr:unnamed protein product [Periconia digitata]